MMIIFNSHVSYIIIICFKNLQLTSIILVIVYSNKISNIVKFLFN